MIDTREKLKAYTLIALGHPLVEIDITSEAHEFAIDNALEFFQEYYFDGADRFYYKHQVTQTDIDNQYLTIPPNIWGINSVFPMTSSGANQASIFDFEYQLRASDMMRTAGNSGLVYYTQVMQNLAMAENLLNIGKQFQFNRNSDKLFISMNWANRTAVGSWIMLDCYAVIDPDVNTKFWNNREFKKYCVALVKKQWAVAYSKYDNITLPGGVTIDGKAMQESAKTEIQEIEQQIINNQSPLGFIVG
jgi:hypothetical protein